MSATRVCPLNHFGKDLDQEEVGPVALEGRPRNDHFPLKSQRGVHFSGGFHVARLVVERELQLSKGDQITEIPADSEDPLK